MSTDIRVIHDEAARRFSTEQDGREVTMTYRDVDAGTVDFTSTFTPPELRGRGLARAVVEEALAWARGEGKRVIPSCWYVAKILEEEKA